MRRRSIDDAASALLEVVLVIGVVAVAVLGVVRPLAGPGGFGFGSGPVFGATPSVGVTVDARAVTIETEPRLPVLGGGGEVAAGDGVEFTIPTGSTVAVSVPDLQQRVGLVGSDVLMGLSALVVLVMLLLLVRSLRRGDPFVPANARRLYVVAAAVGLGGQGALLLESWGRAGVLQHPLVAPYVVPEFTLSFVPLLAGLGVAVAAEVFRRGTALRREVEGLV